QVHSPSFAHAHTYTHTRIQAHVYRHTHIHIHMRMVLLMHRVTHRQHHKHTHTHTHTHTGASEDRTVAGVSSFGELVAGKAICRSCSDISQGLLHAECIWAGKAVSPFYIIHQTRKFHTHAPTSTPGPGPQRTATKHESSF